MSLDDTNMVLIDRDSVCAGDDTEPHQTDLRISPSATIADLLALVAQRHYLASISGGKATWLIEVPGLPKSVIGVAAQQWNAPRLLIPSATPLSVLFPTDRKPSLFFRYWLQSDPDLVFSHLQAGKEPPDRHSR
ncbi:MAG: hypothetical protein V4671_15395 [Armatimonadota bacterium]